MRFIRKPWVAIVLAVFGIQIAFLAGTASILNHYDGSLWHLVSGQDSEYIPLAQAMLSEGRFELPPFYFPTSEPVPETFRTPGYPAYIALIFFLSGGSSVTPGGPMPLPGDAVYVLLASLCLLGAITSGLIYLLARRVGLSLNLGVAAALLFGLSPAVIFLPVTGLGSDVLFTTSFALALLLAFSLTTTRHLMWYVAGIGIVLGFATLTRPIGLYLSIIVIASLPFFSEEALWPAWRKAFMLWGVGTIAFAAVLMPWYVRNAIVIDHFGLSSIPEYSAAYYNIPMFLSAHLHTDEDTERTKIVDAVGNPDSYALRGFGYTDELKAIDLAFLREYFVPYGIFHALKAIPFFVGSGINVTYAVMNIETNGQLEIPFLPKKSENLSTLAYGGNFGAVIANLLTFWPATLERLVWLVLFALTALAPFLTEDKRVRRFFILTLVLILLAAVLASPVVMPRYRVPLEPLIWVAALFSAAALWQRYTTSYALRRSRDHA